MDTQSDTAAPDSDARLIREFFAGQPAGYFVEVGANHPRLLSQTWDLEQAGWSGVLIEPQPDLVDLLRRERSAKVFAVACSTPANAGKTLPMHVAGPMSSLNRERMAAGAEPERIIHVPIRTLDDVLAEAGAPAPLDFLSVDVEGHEIEVLRGFDFARWRPRLILLEDHVGDLSRHKFMQQARYRLIRRANLNGWYVPAGSSVSVGWKDRWRIFRKYYLALPVRKFRNATRRWRGLQPRLENRSVLAKRTLTTCCRA